MKSIQTPSIQRRVVVGLTTVAVAAFVAACGTPGNGEKTYGPTLTDKSFGDSVRQARLRQTIDVDAGKKTPVVVGTDGTSAELAIEQYHKSYEQPKQSINVLGIGSSDAN